MRKKSVFSDGQQLVFSDGQQFKQYQQIELLINPNH